MHKTTINSFAFTIINLLESIEGHMDMAAPTMIAEPCKINKVNKNKKAQDL